MAIGLKVKNGLKAEKVIILENGMTLGRSPEAKVSFDDPKMSGLHVQFVETDEGWAALDMGSKNLFRVNGEKLKKSLLIPGNYIKVGGTEFEIFAVEAPPQVPARPEATRVVRPSIPIEEKTLPPLEKTQAKKKPEPEPPPPPEWPEYFAQFVKMSAPKVRSRQRDIAPFKRAVQLSVIRGLQIETTWTLGYGPREVGPHALDVVIEDPGAPPICFVLFQNEDRLFFVTDRPDVVLLNNSSVRTDSLKDGDLISFASTTIKFSFIES